MNELLTILERHACEMPPIPTAAEPRVHRLNGIRAVVFDVYGTLLISGSGDVGTVAAAPAEAFVDAIHAVGVELKTSPEFGPAAFVQSIQQSHERSRTAGIEYPEVDIIAVWKNVIESLNSKQLLSGCVENLNYQRLAVEYEVRVNPVWPMPGLRDCLAHLRAAEMDLGIVSNAQFFTPLLFPAVVGQSLDSLGFDAELCVWSFQHGHAKPGVFLYQRASELLASRGIEPGEVLYVGNDMLNDVSPAHQVGFRTGLFAGDERSLRLRDGDERIAGISPDLIFTQLNQIALAVGDTNGSEVEG